MKRFMGILLVAVMCAGANGCGIAALTAASAYAVSSIGDKNTEQKKAYNEYKLKMEQLNLERAKQGLPALPVESFNEWNS